MEHQLRVVCQRIRFHLFGLLGIRINLHGDRPGAYFYTEASPGTEQLITALERDVRRPDSEAGVLLCL